MIRPYKDQFPRIHPSAYIDPSAQVIGDVEIGEDVSVWCNAVIRGDVNVIRIGRKTNVQDGALLHVTYRTFPLILGDEVTIAHGAIVHGCTVEDRSLIAMGAKILDGAVIGEESIVAAGSLVPEGKAIPPRSLVMGVPARPVRTVSDEELAYFIEAMERYVLEAREYKKMEGNK
jgi:carbonic anhydrase/acetyltransferase-like protein (isoleucine patch superfamily)